MTFGLYQYPDEKETEEFCVVLTGNGFLILKNKDNNNIKIRCKVSHLYSINEKIYKKQGEFLWKIIT